MTDLITQEEQAWEHHRLHGIRAIPTWEEVVEGVEERAFAAGWAARDVEVAELREQLRHSARMLPTQKRPDLEFPPEYYEADDDPLTMSVERVAEGGKNDD